MFNEETEYPKRNKETFKQFEYNDHQNIISPLIEVGVGVINLLPPDYMHLVCLGVVRRILSYMKKGKMEGGGQVEKYLLTRLTKFQVYFYH